MRRLGAFAAVVLATAAQPQSPAAGSERDRILERAREISLAYSRSLPDFLCIETIRRDVNFRGPAWVDMDTLTVQVTYFHEKESYKLLQKSGHATEQSYDSVAGATTAGEFGSTLRWIFDSESQTEFQFERSGRRRSAIFRYRVSAANSRYKLVSGLQSTVVGYHGEVEIDPGSAYVVRVTMVADIPRGFPIRESATTVEYGSVSLDGREYLLPVHAEVEAADVPHGAADPSLPPFPSATPETRYRNRIDFRGYRRFTVDSHLIPQ